MVLLDLKYSGPYALYFPTKGWIDFFFFLWKHFQRMRGRTFSETFRKPLFVKCHMPIPESATYGGNALNALPLVWSWEWVSFPQAQESCALGLTI